MNESHEQSIVVLKFGGTSVSSRARWETIARIANERIAANEKPFFVCSALSGVSNLLEDLVALAPSAEFAPALAEIREKHQKLSDELGIDADATWRPVYEELEKVIKGAALLGETSPRTHARVLSCGELMSTRMGAAFLTRQGVQTRWLDARNALKAVDDPLASARRAYLSSGCDYEADATLRDEVVHDPVDAFITQGFIARNDDGDTVLLGRGGSDTSAAYFAAKLRATRCEIWTDVPGMFTADPRIVPNARHLLFVDYDEAQEIATTGAKVLHPRCIGPCKDAGIPIHIRSTPEPGLVGTVISLPSGERRPGVKAISSKKGVTLISMETVGMWQQVGFLADAFNTFKAHGLSIDQVSTSETNVTVSLDPTANALTNEVIESLLAELNAFCQAREISPATAVSLVGTGIRSILHQLGDALQLFEEQRIYIVTQSSNDLNITFVVDEDQAVRLVKKLHESLFAHARKNDTFGATWQELLGNGEPASEQRWWMTRREELLRIDVGERPAYVYDLSEVRARAEALTAMKNVDRIFYAMKANANPEVLRTIHAAGAGFECVSVGEIEHVMETIPSLTGDGILFTPNFAPIEEYRFAFERHIHVNLDNLHPLREHPEVFAGRSISVRIDPGRGRGHHEHVKTAGRGSKFGVDYSDIDELLSLCEAHDVTVVGLHAHAGSGILAASHWADVAALLEEYAQRFPGIRVLDLGGGLGVIERSGQAPLDLDAVDESLARVKDAFDVEIWLEPGRYFVANSGVLLARVTQTKDKGDVHYVGINAGMHTLIRPALYGAYHRIVNLTRYGQPRDIVANIVGPICETGDTLGHARQLPATREGDVLLIDTAGAYGMVMASNYNLRGFAQEVLLD